MIISKCRHAYLIKFITVAAFQIYAQRGEDVAKTGGLRPCIILFCLFDLIL